MAKLKEYLGDLNEDLREAGEERISTMGLGRFIGRSPYAFPNIAAGRESPNHRVIRDIVKSWPGTKEQKLVMAEDLFAAACLDTGKITIEFPKPYTIEAKKRIREIARDAALICTEQIP
jgi:hypothetical protein